MKHVVEILVLVAVNLYFLYYYPQVDIVGRIMFSFLTAIFVEQQFLMAELKRKTNGGA